MYRARFCRGPQQLRLCIACTAEYATDIELHVHTYAVSVAAREARPTMCCIRFFIVALLVPPRYALFFVSYQELDQEGRIM